MTQEIKLYGQTQNNAFAGHVYAEGKAVAAVILHLPKDFWQSETNKAGRGRPRGRNDKRLLRDIKTYAAHDIVHELLKRDCQKVTAKQKQALVLAATGETGRDEFNDSVAHAADNDRQFRRRLDNAKKALSDFQVKINVSTSNPADWTWAAVSRDGRAWFYFWGGEIVECVAQPGSKPGSLLLKAVGQTRTK